VSKLNDRVVVVTGASAGVGRATVRALAVAGARVGLIARGGDGLAAAEAEVRAAGALAHAVSADVAVAEQVEQAAEAIERALGPIDVWVNNAMTAVLAEVRHTTAEEFRRVTEVVYLGNVNGTLAALRRMQARDRGTIVQVGSALAYRGIAMQAGYCGAKHAIKGFTESLRTELLHQHSNVRVTMVHLPGLNTTQFGWVRTTLRRHPQPVPPIYQPEVAAKAILWAAAHPRRRELLVGYPTVGTVWANKFVPGLIDRYLARTNYQAQQTDQPISPDRPDYVFEPLPGDHGSHGIFDDQAHDRSPQLIFTTHRRSATAGVVGLAGVVAAGAARHRGGRRTVRR